MSGKGKAVETRTGDVGGSSSKEVEVYGRKFSQSLVFDMTDKAIVKAMEEVTVDDIKRLVKSLEIIQSSEIEVSMYSIFEFMGFDPIQVIKKLLLINKNYREVLKVVEETEEILKQDIMLMIAANIYMGNLQAKSVSRRSGTARYVLTYLQKKYQLKIGSTGTGLSGDTLTFPRVANSFPALTTRMATVLPTKDFPSGKFKTLLLPKFMRVSAFASFCPIEMAARTRLFLLHAVCSYSCDQSVVVSEGEAKKPENKSKKLVPITPLEAFGMQWNFILVASTSPVPAFGMKKNMHREFKTNELYKNLLPIVKNLRDIAKDTTPVPTEDEFKLDLKEFMEKAKRGESKEIVVEPPKVVEVDDDE